MNFNLFLLEAAATTGEANAQPGGVGGILGMALPFIVMLALMYFLIIRPQKKKEKAEKAMRDNLQVGDEIVTIGGIYGRVISLKEDTIVIESKSDHSKMTIARWAMQQNLTVHDDTPSK